MHMMQYKISNTDCDQVYIGDTNKNLHARVKAKVRNHRAELQIYLIKLNIFFFIYFYLRD